MTPQPKPLAFVIMPFDEDLKEVYESFLVPVLAEVGYEVLRADDLVNQQNILRDIVGSIARSEIVVADLTGLNPNVFYELGVAHGLGRPVILLTQDIDEVPFDLKSYRILVYDVHFARIEAARGALRETALGAINGTLKFGSPVTDFAAGSGFLAPRPGTATVSERPSGAQPADEPLGWLDHAVAMEQGFAGLMESLGEISAATASITEDTGLYTERLERAKAGGDTGRSARLRFIASEYARELRSYAERVGAANEAYEQAAAGTQNSIEALIALRGLGGVDDRRQLEQFLAVLAGVEAAATGARNTFVRTREILRSGEGIERRLSVACHVAGRELDRLVGNIDKTIASIQRGIVVAGQALAALGAAP